jgi:hypothetical protein
VQGTGADGLRLALAILYERPDECPGAVPILAVHHEIVVECDEADAEEVEAWLERAMIDGMDGVLDGAGVGGRACRSRLRSSAAGPGPGKGRRRGRHPAGGRSFSGLR